MGGIWAGWMLVGDGAILAIELGEATLVAIQMYLIGIRDVTNDNQITFVLYANVLFYRLPKNQTLS